MTYINRGAFLLTNTPYTVYNIFTDTIRGIIMKFLRAVTVAILLCLTFSTTAFAAQEQKHTFADVEKGKWYYDEVYDAYNNGIMVGVSDTEFAPNSIVTREMFVTALSRIAMTSVEEYHEHDAGFTDVDIEKWYADAIEWAASDGIVYGITETEFGVGQAVTREQIAAFVSRFIHTYFYKINEVKQPAPRFTDECSEYAVDAIEFMRVTGLISGKKEGVFGAGDNATRAEAAAILLRLYSAIREPVFGFDFNADEISQMGVFCDIYTKDIIVTADNDIERFVKYLNDTPIERAEFIGHTAGWDHKISIYDTSGKRVFTLYFTTSYFLINECLYTVEGDYFRPVVDAVK